MTPRRVRRALLLGLLGACACRSPATPRAERSPCDERFAQASKTCQQVASRCTSAGACLQALPDIDDP